MKRRSFIKQSMAAAGGLALASPLMASVLGEKTSLHPVGIQLFTVMKEIDEDLTGTLTKIAALGYQELESAYSVKGGYYGLKPKEFASMTKDLGLAWKSHHVLGVPFIPPPEMKLPPAFAKMRSLKMNHQELVDEAAEGGVEFLVCAAISFGTTDEINSSLEILNKTAEACKKAGIGFAYHNHDAEFKPVDGKLPYDIFLSQISGDLMKMELDLAWATKAGIDPVLLFKKHPGRFPLWHVKDLDAEFKQILPVGQGVIDYKRIFAEAKIAGMKHFFVEHDMPANAFESLAASIKNVNEVIKPAK